MAQAELQTHANTPQRRAIIVLGMHRAGTSAVTRVLNLLGAALPEQLVPPQPDNNALGFWEPLGIVDLHDELLAALGSSWADFNPIAPAWFDSAEAAAYRERLVALLERDYGDAPLFVIKDPRICRLVPLWLPVLERIGAAPHFVIPLRNPLEVAASLERRDGLGLTEASLIWLRHVLDGERASRPFPRTLFAFDDLMADWRAVVRRIESHQGLEWPRAAERISAEVESFLSPSHRHHRCTDHDLAQRADVPSWTRIAYDALTRLAHADAGANAILDDTARAFDQGCRVFQPIQAEHASYLERQLAACQADLSAVQANANAQIEYRDALITQLHHQLAEEKANASAQVGQRDALLTQARAHLAAEQANAGAQIEYRDALAAQLSERLTAEQTNIRELEDNIRELEDNIRELEDNIRELQAKLAAPRYLLKHLPRLIWHRLRASKARQRVTP